MKKIFSVICFENQWVVNKGNVRIKIEFQFVKSVETDIDWTDVINSKQRAMKYSNSVKVRVGYERI